MAGNVDNLILQKHNLSSENEAWDHQIIKTFILQNKKPSLPNQPLLEQGDNLTSPKWSSRSTCTPFNGPPLLKVKTKKVDN